jgi:hypothetical protein
MHQNQDNENFFSAKLPGTDVMILKIFSLKNFAKILAFFGSNCC